jgi:hypothetical protein
MTTTTSSADAPMLDGDRLLRWIVAAVLAGAGLIHVAFAPDHLAESISHGAFFVAVAWIQFALALVVGTGRGGPLTLRIAVAANLAVIAAWGWSRTVGIGGEVEAVGYPDVLASTLAAAAVVGCIVLATRRLEDVRIHPSAGGAWAGASAMAVTMLVTASLVPSLAGDHSHAADGEGHTHTTESAAATHDHGTGAGTGGDASATGHDHGSGSGTETAVGGTATGGHDHGTASVGQAASTTAAGHDHGTAADGVVPAGNATDDGFLSHDHGTDTTTTEAPHDHGTDTTTTVPHDHGSSGSGEGSSTGSGSGSGSSTDGHDHGTGTGTGTDTWEAQRKAALIGGASEAKILAVNAASYEFLSSQIRKLSNGFKGLTDKQREQRIEWFTTYTVAHAVDAGHGGNHTHGPVPWQSMGAADTIALQGELRQAATVVAKYPTAADAMAAGYFLVTPWVPGIGAHYMNTNYLKAFDPTKPAILLYNGNSPSSVLVGVSYAIWQNAIPPGFTGPNDNWHEHPQLCMIGGFVAGGDNTPADLCAMVGGYKGNGLGSSHLWMMHLWQVPGWESGWGLFSGENPQINVATTDVGD